MTNEHKQFAFPTQLLNTIRVKHMTLKRPNKLKNIKGNIIHHNELTNRNIYNLLF